MAEGFCFIYLAFGFSCAVNLSVQCIGWLGANMSAGVCVRSGHVIQRCYNGNPR